MVIRLGFHYTRTDSSLFVNHATDHIMFVFLYVDDVVFIGSNSAKLQQFADALHKQFTLKDMGTWLIF